MQESAENYLETILVLAREQPYVHPIDVATELGFSKPSISVATKDLRQSGYVQMGDQEHIMLTSSGQIIADTMYEHRTLLSNWLVYLGVDPRTAAEDTCRMGRTLSVEGSDAIKHRIAHGHELPDQEGAYA